MNRNTDNEHLDGDDLLVEFALQTLAKNSELPDTSPLLAKDVDKMMQARSGHTLDQDVAPAKHAPASFGKKKSKSSRRHSIRVIALATIVFMAFSSLAYAGLLPEPVQKSVAKVAKRAGVELPESRREAKERKGLPNETEKTETPAEKEYEDAPAGKSGQDNHSDTRN